MASSRRQGAGEVLNTYSSAGGYDYSSISTWETDTDVNCVTGAVTYTLMVQRGVHTISGVTFSGATTSSSYFRKIRPHGPHDVAREFAAGSYSYWHGHSGHMISGSLAANLRLGASGRIFNLNENYFSLEDIVFYDPRSASAGYTYISISGDYCKIIGNWFREIKDTGGSYDSYTVLPAAAITLYAINNVFYANKDCIASSQICTVYAYNNTFYANSRYDFNVWQATANTLIKNCRYLTKNGSAYTETTNYTSATEPPWQMVSPYFCPYVHTSDYGSKIYACGTDLSADAYFAFDDDMNFNIRSLWSIGALDGKYSCRKIGVNEKWKYYTSAGGYDYSVLNTWEADTDIDLVTDTSTRRLYIIYGIHDDELSAAGATTNSLYSRIICPNGWDHLTCNVWHRGEAVISGSIACFQSTDSSVHPFYCTEAWFAIYDLVVSPDYSSQSNFRRAFYFNAPASTSCFVVGCVVVDFTWANQECTFFCGTGNGTHYLINCLGLRVRNYVFLAWGNGAGTACSFVAYNNSAYGCGNPDYLYGNSPLSAVAYNSIAYNFQAGWSLYTCIENSAGDSYPSWKDVSSDNFMLAENDTEAIGEGTNLFWSTYGFADDAIGRSRTGAYRRTSTKYDIGWHQSGLFKAANMQAYLKKTFTKTANLNAYMFRAYALYAEMAAMLNVSGLTTSADMNAHLIEEQNIQAQLQAYLQALGDVEAQLNAYLNGEVTIEADLDAYLVNAGVNIEADLNAYLQKASFVGSDLNAYLQKAFTKQAQLNAYLKQAGITVSANLNAHLTWSFFLTANLNAYLYIAAALAPSLIVFMVTPAVFSAGQRALVSVEAREVLSIKERPSLAGDERTALAATGALDVLGGETVNLAYKSRSILACDETPGFFADRLLLTANETPNFFHGGH